MNIDKQIDIMNESLKNGVNIVVLSMLKSKHVLDYINKFIKTDSISDKMLDDIHDIIVAAKTIYDDSRYVDPFTDYLYDTMLTKFKSYRDEPFGMSQKGLATSSYKYDDLSGTLDKSHFIYTSERPDNDIRKSLEEWFYNDLPLDNDTKISVLINQKKDGTSVTIDYRYDGKHSYIADSAISRGKKDYGEGTDCSAVSPNNIFDGRKIYKILNYYPEYIGIQYEFLISDKKKAEFEKYLKQKFVNNRSAASGLLRRMLFAGKKDLKEYKKMMSLVPVGFDILPEYRSQLYYDIPWDRLYEVMCETFIYGDITMEYDVIHGTKREILRQFHDIANKQIANRSKLNHAIDGMVITILDKDIVERLGRKNNINQFQMAYKFPEEGYKTIVRGMTITTGNFGYKEILLDVDPVILNGTTQSKAQVHSLKKFNKMKLRIGDELILKLSGDVIPFGYKDDTCKSGTGHKLKLPEFCECGERLEEEKNKLRCPNKHCPYRVIGSLTTFFTELNSKGIGEKTCKQLYSEMGITKPSQILKLTKDDFKKMKGFKDASAELCMKTISDIVNKPRALSSVISALGIDSFRSSTVEKVLSMFSISDIIEMIDNNDKDELINSLKKCPGIDKNANAIADGLISNINELKELLSIISIKKDQPTSFDKTILISGIRNDEKLEDIAHAAGFNVKDSGKKFDILVIKDQSMLSKSKAIYAKSKNLPIMLRDEFIKKYGGSGND